MTKYNVHIFREMRLFFPGIEADSPAEAASTASDTDTCHATEAEECDGIDLSAMVDVDGNEDFTKSQIIDFEPQRFLSVASLLVTSLTNLAEQADEDCPLHHRTRHFVEALEEAKAVLAQVAGGAA